MAKSSKKGSTKNKESSHNLKKTREPIREKNRIDYKHHNKNSKKKETIEKVKYEEKSQNNNNLDLNLLKIATIVLGIIFIIFLIIFVLMYVNSENQNTSSTTYLNTANNNSELTNLNEDLNISNLKLQIIVNDDCKYCQQDLIAKDILILLNSSNISVEILNVSSIEAKELKQSLYNQGLAFEFTPLFILSKELKLHYLFNESQFKELFVEIESGYLLSPQITQVKYLDTHFKLPDETITIGNRDGVSIVYISDYYCQRCRIMEGDQQLIASAQEQEIVPINYTAPIPQLLLNSLFVNSTQDLSYSFTFIPAPVTPDSTLSHKAAYCAHKQDAFVAMHGSLMNLNDVSLTTQEYSNLAQSLNLNIEEFNSCFNSSEVNNFINSTQEFLIELGVSSLPVLLVGKYPVTNILDLQTLELLLRNEVELKFEN